MKKLSWELIGKILIFTLIAFAVGSYFAFRKKGFNRIISDDDAYNIVAKWQLPDDLYEVSGIVWLGDNKLACVQDEDGKIYIYNLKTSKIEREIKFGKEGDYEGIAAVNKDLYVIRSNGKLFEIKNYETEDFKVQEYKTELTSKQNVEGLCYDKKQNRLLLAIKGQEKESDDYKGIYAFSIADKTMDSEPVYKINFNDSIFNKVSKNKLYRKISPSEIAVNPKSGDIYILEGKAPKLMIMDRKGNYKYLYNLDTDTFPQPEGMTFDDEGKLYISNEGTGGSATILMTEIADLKKGKTSK